MTEMSWLTAGNTTYLTSSEMKYTYYNHVLRLIQKKSLKDALGFINIKAKKLCWRHKVTLAEITTIPNIRPLSPDAVKLAQEL